MMWEYQTIELPQPDSTLTYKDLTGLLSDYNSVLNEAGGGGWELVSTVAPGVIGPKHVLFGIFKRPKE